MALTRGGLTTVPKPVDRFACLACIDEGIVPLADDWMPCTCKAGDRWRDNPPVCKCGRPAVYCLLSATPLCKVHGTAEAIRGKLR